MEYLALDIEGLVLFKPRKIEDHRGFFAETFRQNIFDESVGVGQKFVQDNHSFSEKKGTVRGLHYQAPPHAQGKLVRCVAGKILDVAVDVRRGSPHFGQHVSAELSHENGHQLWVPAGFLHGFITLSDKCHVAYKVTDYYDHESENNVLWCDDDLAIDWGELQSSAIISDKDKDASAFSNWVSPFSYA